MATVMTTMIDR